MNQKVDQDKKDFKSYIEQALTCAGYAEEKGLIDNRGLATVGDSLLSFLFLDYIRGYYKNLDMESLTNWKEVIQNNRILNIIGKELLGSELINAIKSDRSGKKQYATILEAYVYALYLSGGLSVASDYVTGKVVQTLKLEPLKSKTIEIYNEKANNEKNGKRWKKLVIDFTKFCE